MAKHRLVAMVVLEADDVRLDLENTDLSTPEKREAVRVAVVENIKHVERVVFVCNEPMAQAMVRSHMLASEMAEVIDCAASQSETHH